MTEYHTLLIDDDPHTLNLFQSYIRQESLGTVIPCFDPREARKCLSEDTYSCIILDLDLPYISGRELFDSFSIEYPDIPIIVVSGEDSVNTPVELMKIGALDFLRKPVTVPIFISALRRALEIWDLRQEVNALSHNILLGHLKKPEIFSGIVTASDSMKAIFRYIEAIAGSPKPILVTGESGTGKELMARAIHEISRPQGRFVAINIAGLDDTVFSDTLFGHKRGAYTGADTIRKGLIEQAAGGTLFLDEIGDLEPTSQIKLLRLLQDGEYYPLGSDSPEKMDAHIILATNADLTALQMRGKFRTDLYFRIIFHRIELPALRERPEDIPLLVESFANETAKQLNRDIPPIPDEAVRLVRNYPFPGNVRELQSLIFDTLSRSDTQSFNIEYMRNYVEKTTKTNKDEQGSESQIQNEVTPTVRVSTVEPQRFFYNGNFPNLSEVDDFFIGEAMKLADGNQTRAAELLGISQSTLSRRFSVKR